MLAAHVAAHRPGDDPMRHLLAMSGDVMSPSSMAWHWRLTAIRAEIPQLEPRGCCGLVADCGLSQFERTPSDLRQNQAFFSTM
jgi:hypothetical protein